MFNNSPKMSAQSSTVIPSNPRKFSEKIALLTQKGAEETAEFTKIMAECAAVLEKANAPRPSRVTVASPMPSAMPRHLSPNFSNSRHASLPNVGIGVQLATVQGVITTNQPNMVQGLIHPGQQITLTHPTTLKALEQQNRMPNLANLGVTQTLTTRRSSSGSGAHANAHESHNMVPHNVTNSSSSSNINQSAGPIRQHKSRIDTSPYRAERSERYSTSSATGSSINYNHLSPPETWRRVYSDSSIPAAINVGGTNETTSTGASGVPSPGTNYSESGSPLQGTSPPYLNTGRDGYYSNPMDSTDAETQGQNFPSYLSLPKDGIENKPGSLPDLTNCYVSGSPRQPETTHCEDQTSVYSSMLGSNPRIVNVQAHQQPQQQQQQSNSSSPTSANIRLSDDEVSELLDIPISLVSGLDDGLNHQMTNGSLLQQNQANKVILQPYCDTVSPGVEVKVSKANSVDQRVVIIDQHPPPYLQMNKDVKSLPISSSLSQYRNPQIIPPPSSPIGFNSPFERSTSPIDMVSSPHHSPLHPPASGSPHWNSELMSAQQQFQRCNMRDSNSPGMYYSQTPQSNSYQQPLDLFGYMKGDNSQHHQYNNQGQVQSPNPQTPSSIPEIILTDTDRFQGGFDDLDLFSSEFDLGRLDESMIKLLSESGSSMDQQITDPATEEHLKKL